MRATVIALFVLMSLAGLAQDAKPQAQKGEFPLVIYHKGFHNCCGLSRGEALQVWSSGRVLYLWEEAEVGWGAAPVQPQQTSGLTPQEIYEESLKQQQAIRSTVCDSYEVQLNTRETEELESLLDSAAVRSLAKNFFASEGIDWSRTLTIEIDRPERVQQIRIADLLENEDGYPVALKELLSAMFRIETQTLTTGTHRSRESSSACPKLADKQKPDWDAADPTITNRQ